MSDLQCPARFLVLGCADESLADPALVDGLRAERVALVYDAAATPGAERERQGPARLAAAIGVPHRTLDDALAVDDVRHGRVGLLEDLADVHRGETVVVTTGGRPGRPVERVDVTVDADGTRVDPVTPA
jgi:hypothetical protein